MIFKSLEVGENLSETATFYYERHCGAGAQVLVPCGVCPGVHIIKTFQLDGKRAAANIRPSNLDSLRPN
jgi:hypothetical protein